MISEQVIKNCSGELSIKQLIYWVDLIDYYCYKWARLILSASYQDRASSLVGQGWILLGHSGPPPGLTVDLSN